MLNKRERTDRGASHGAALAADRHKRASGLLRRLGHGAAKHRVLVVEDDPAIGALLEHILAPQGFEVSVVGDGSRGLATLHSSTFDALIVDVMLPGLDGLEVVRAVRAHPQTTSMAIMLLTAKTDDRSTWEGWRSGCDCYLTKPFDPSQLVGQLTRLVSGSKGGER